MSKLLGSVCAICLLSACSGVPVVAPREVSSAYQMSELAASAGKAPVGVSVRGRPFGLDDQTAAGRITPMLSTTGPAAGRLAAAAGPTEKPIHHLIFDFAAAPDETAEELCRGGRAGVGAGTAPSGDRVSVLGALCVGVTPLTWAVGRVEPTNGVDSSAFIALMNRMGSLLMPSDNPWARGEGGGANRIGS